MTLKFYCHTAPDPSNPFPEDGCEVLLSVSIIRDSNGNFTPISQTGEGFMEMVDTIIANPKVKKVTLLNTAFLQRHRKALELWAGEGVDLEYVEGRAEDLARQDSEDWLKENAEAIGKLRSICGNNFGVLDWEELLKSPEFKTRLVEVNGLYNSGSGISNGKLVSINTSSFKRAVRNLLNFFMESNKLSQVLIRKINDPEVKDRSKNRDIVKIGMRKIILEECTLRTFLSFSYEIYRGGLNVPAIMLYNAYGKQDNMQFVTIGDEEEIKHATEVAIQRSSRGGPKIVSSAPMAVAAASVSMLPPQLTSIPIPERASVRQEVVTQPPSFDASERQFSGQGTQSFFGSAVPPPQPSFINAPKGIMRYYPRAMSILLKSNPAARVNLPNGVSVYLYDNPESAAVCVVQFLKELGCFSQSGAAVNKKPEQSQPHIKLAQPPIRVDLPSGISVYCQNLVCAAQFLKESQDQWFFSPAAAKSIKPLPYVYEAPSKPGGYK